MKHTTLTLALALALALPAIADDAAAEPTGLRLPSGRYVPRAAVARHFDTAATDDSMSSRLFDLTSSRYLHVPRHAAPIDLHERTSAAAPHLLRGDLMDDALVLVDQVALPRAALHDVHVREGPRYAFAVADHTVVAAWGPHFHVVPLDLVAHPGVYVSSRPVKPISSAVPPPHHRPTTATTVPPVPDPHGGDDPRFPIEDAVHVAGSCGRHDRARIVQLAVAFDKQFCVRYGGDGKRAVAALRAIVYRSEIPLRAATCVRLRVSSVEGYCAAAVSDPYQMLRGRVSHDVLHGFRDIWNGRRAGVPRDLAFLVSGFVDSSNVAGVAYTGSACNIGYAYGWVELGDVAIFAHEIGHTLNAKHASSGLMTPVVPSNSALQFSEATLSQIRAFVESGRASCLAMSTEHVNTPVNAPKKAPAPAPPRQIYRPSPRPIQRRKPQPKRRTHAKPPPKKSPRRKYVPKTCRDGFSQKKSLVCKSNKLGQLTGRHGRISVQLLQRHDRFDLVMAASKEVKIVEYGRLLTMNAHVRARSVGNKRAANHGAVQVTSKWPTTQIRLAGQQLTCCAKPLFAHVRIKMCTRNRPSRCSMQYRRFSVRVACQNMCRWRVTLPMSVSRKCPRCFP